MKIVLIPTESELNLAGNVGVLRMVYATRTGLQRRWGNNDAGSSDHIGGAIGEMMLAKHRNVYWAGTIGTTKAASDVSACYQVRATDNPNGKLIAHETDNDNQPFVLVRVLLPEVHLMGWLWGSEAKQQEHWRKEGVRHPAYFAWPVHDMETLPDETTVRERMKESSGDRS